MLYIPQLFLTSWLLTSFKLYCSNILFANKTLYVARTFGNGSGLLIVITLMAQIQVKFFTHQEKFKVEDVPFSVLGTVTSLELNDLINKLLHSQDNDDEKKPTSILFEFLLDGEFLRTSLLDHITTKGLSVESVLPVEYLEKQIAPELQSCLEHNDWVSGIHLNDKFVLTGTYDCAINIWNRNSSEKVCSRIEHSEPVKAVTWFNVIRDESLHFLSASQDQSIILWDFDPETGKTKPLFRCKGHSKSVDCVSVNKSNSNFVSGSWDCTVKLWSTSIVPEEGAEAQLIEDLSNRKRQKIERKGYPRSPIMTLSGHKELVSGLLWLNESEVCSASWDHTLRIWDLNEGSEKSLQRGTKAITSFDYSPLNRTIVTGNTDRHIRIWDPRSSEGVVIKANLTSHRNWVTCVKWSPTLPHSVVSGSLDNYVKMWDTRSPKTPLYDMTAHQDKVMCLDWTLPRVIGTGGGDNKSFLFSTDDGSIDRTFA